MKFLELKNASIIRSAEKSVEGGLKVSKLIETLRANKVSGLVERIATLEAGNKLPKLGKFDAYITNALKNVSAEEIKADFLQKHRNKLLYATEEQGAEILGLMPKLVANQLKLRDFLISRFGFKKQNKKEKSNKMTKKEQNKKCKVVLPETVAA